MNTIFKTDFKFPRQISKYEGKVRDVYSLEDDILVIVASERISALEHELGARLLFRTTRQVSLTQAGSEFVQDAKKILTDIEKSMSNVRHTAESDLHNIRVSGVDEAISMLLPKALLLFKRSDPKVHVQVLEISSSDAST